MLFESDIVEASDFVDDDLIASSSIVDEVVDDCWLSVGGLFGSITLTTILMLFETQVPPLVLFMPLNVVFEVAVKQEKVKNYN